LFERITSIDVKNSASWKNKIFLTFDVDWCSDEILEHALDTIEEYDVKATFFVTHETKLLERMRENTKIELGIHPNFNPLLNGDFRYGKNYKEVIDFYMKIVPEAKSSRSHSITHNSHILEELIARGITHDSNTLVPFSSNSYLEPWKYWSDALTRVPYFWEDDVHCIYNWEWNVEKFICYEGIKVFDFHPIHIFLNTEYLDRYEKSRKWHNCEENLPKHRHEGYGARSFLIDLIEK